MNASTILPQSTPSTLKLSAFHFGQNDAREGAAFAPESLFVRRQDQIAYVLGFESVAGVSPMTRQFTRMPIAARVGFPAPKATAVTASVNWESDKAIVPMSATQIAAKCSNARRTENATYANIVKNIEKRQRRIEAMAAKTAAFMDGIYAGDILFI